MNWTESIPLASSVTAKLIETMNHSNTNNNSTTTVVIDDEITFVPPQWMVNFVAFRKQLFLKTVEPIILQLVGPMEDEATLQARQEEEAQQLTSSLYEEEENLFSLHYDETHRRLGFLPNYVEDVTAFKESSMSFASMIMLFVIMSCLFLIFLSCFYHNQKTSPLFISPRRHRLPKLVPPPLPIDGYFDWVKICFFLSDDEVIQRIGFDSLVFLRFHRLALRCIVKMSVFSFLVLLPLNYTGGGHAKAQDIKGYVGSLFFTDFLRFTMANVSGGSPRLWVHCFAAYLLTAIVVRELLIEYETFNSIRHCYLLQREPHLRTVLVTNIPRHLRSPDKIGAYFRHVYPNAVKHVAMCQNLLRLEELVEQRTEILAQIEKEILMLCRSEKRKLFERSTWATIVHACRVFTKLEDCGIVDGSQERLARLYTQLEEMNNQVELEQNRRRRVMKKLDRMEAGEGRKDIDYILASPFVSTNDPKQRKLLGLKNSYPVGSYRPPTETIPEERHQDYEVETNEDIDSALRGASSTYIPNAGSQLRARSPTNHTDDFQDHQYNVPFENPSSIKPKPLVKAKSAIRRYSRLAREVSFFGRPIRSSMNVNDDGHIEDHINEVTDKAFVVMRTFTAATIAIQSMHSSKPGAMEVKTAPEPRDINWPNIYVSKGALRTRSILGEFVVLLIITFYVIPIALISLLVSESALVSSSPRLAQLDQATALFASVIAMVQPLCIVALQQCLPPLFMAIGRMEGLVAFSEVQMRAFSRYFLFQVLNVFLVTTVAGSIFDTIAIIVETPEAAFEMLGNSLPRMSSFFITFVTIKTFFGLGFELVRTMAIVQATLRYILAPNQTLRRARGRIAGMRAIDDPGWFPFHKILAQDMLVVVISVVFAVVAPIVLLPCSLFCLFSRIMWTHHHMYVYESVFESGGQFWPKIFRRFVFGLIIAQMTITGQFILKEARHEAYATIALMFMTYVFLRRTRARYDPTSNTLPLEIATVMDISLSQEEEAAKRQQQQQREETVNIKRPIIGARSYDEKQSQTTDSVSDTEVIDHDDNLGTSIGGYDPFEQAYLQPSLRANPRAKPEQPFPPAQLGREEVFFGGNYSATSSESDLLDSGATVRLKSMNQQDRRLVNRWWKDQLQRAGPQNILAILAGEECGTLRIGKRANLVEPVSLQDDHVFV